MSILPTVVVGAQCARPLFTSGPTAFVVVLFLLRAAALASRFLDEPPRRIGARRSLFSAVVGVTTVVVVDSTLSPVDWCNPVPDVGHARKPLR